MVRGMISTVLDGKQDIDIGIGMDWDGFGMEGWKGAFGSEWEWKDWTVHWNWDGTRVKCDDAFGLRQG